MNKSRRSRPGLVCSVVRLWESSRGPAATGCSRLTERHMEGCAECRAFFIEDAGFEQSLRRDATRLCAAPPDSGLEQRILQAVKAAKAQPDEERMARQELSPVWGRALLASLAVALGVVFWVRLPAPALDTVPDSARVMTTLTTVETPRPAAKQGATAPVIAVWWSTLEARGAELAKTEKNPLEQELESVRTDARAVIGFLALNFMPSRPEREAPPSQG